MLALIENVNNKENIMFYNGYILSSKIETVTNGKGTSLFINLPGVKKKDISIKTELDYFKVDVEADVRGKPFVYSERFLVTKHFDIDKLSAKLEDGVLEVHIPTKVKYAEKSITVQ
jgi:HSP20 family molecular chaperone IbpA